jgi:hypothetical protein
MINLKTGEFKLDEYNLVIHPDLTLFEFKAGDIPFQEGYASPEGAASFLFKGKLETLDAQFSILFDKQIFCVLSVIFDEKYNLGPGDKIEAWLTQITGEPLPFEYEWGCLGTDVGGKDNSDFSVVTKYSILENCKRSYPKYNNLKDFYASLHGAEKLRRQLYGE